MSNLSSRRRPTPCLRALCNSASRNLPLVLGASLLVATTAHAQSGDDAGMLGRIVLTASGFEQLLKDAPASISVISAEELKKGQFTSLFDAIRNVQGVTLTGVANENDIFMRGLSGSYTLILVDGKRQSTRDARTNGNAGFEQKYIPPISAIERIEVVRGPMSSLYGSDAMGGVINIITKKVSDDFGGEVTLDTTINQHERFGNSRQASFYLNGPILADRLGFQIWGRALRKDAADASVTNGENGADEYDLTGRLIWTPVETQDVMLEIGRANAEVTPVANTSYSDNRRDHASLTHIGRWDFGTSEISLSREVSQRTTYNGTPGSWTEQPRKPEITNTVLDAKLTAELGANGEHKVVFGGQFFRADLEDVNPGLNDNIVRKYGADQRALFIEDEWQITDSFALTGGLRYNDHSEYKGHFTPRLYGVWSVTDALTLKGGVSTGFRAPEVRQITPGYAYTTGGSNCRRDRNCGVILADPALKAETSTSYELAMMYDSGDMQFGATLFQTEFKDKITNYRTTGKWTDGPQYQADDGNWYYYDIFYNSNISRATIKGIELTYDWAATDDLKLRANYTYTHSRQKGGDYAGFPLERTPEHMASLRIDWNTPVENLGTWASATYHGSEIHGALRAGSNGTPIVINGKTGRKYAPYATVDVGADYAVNDQVNVNVAVYNLFDKNVVSEESNNVVEGRRLWLGVTTRF